MTDTPATAPAIAPAGAAPSPAPASSSVGGTPTYDSPSAEAARQTIRDRIADREFGARLLKREEAAMREWQSLHSAGFPPLQQTTLENVQDLAANDELRRQSEQMESGIAALLKIADLTPRQQDEIRRQQPIAEWEQKVARQEIERLKRDKAWVRRYLEGGREENTTFTRLHQIISLPTARTATTYPVK
jgi:hypothetical protein